MAPGAIVSQKDGKQWTVGPKGGTYFSDAASKQLDVNQSQEEWWAKDTLEAVAAYNKSVDENNAKAREGIVPAEPKKKVGWWF